MAAVFTLNMYMPEETIFSGEVVSLTVPSSGGRLGVLAHHAPLVAMLTDGLVVVKDASGAVRKFMIAGRGCLEVAHNAATLLLEKAEPAD